MLDVALIHVMRFIPFAVLLILIVHPTSGGTQNETLNDSCPDCYCERNSLASRDYGYCAFHAGIKRLHSAVSSFTVTGLEFTAMLLISRT